MPKKKTDSANDEFDASTILVLEGLDAIRYRPGMYIGSTGSYGLHHMIYEIVMCAVDDARDGICKHITVNLLPGGKVELAYECGRQRHPPMDISTMEVLFTTLHMEESLAGSGCHTGSYVCAYTLVNALSEELIVEGCDGKTAYRQPYERGVPCSPPVITGETTQNGYRIVYKPDAGIFRETAFDFNKLRERLRELAFLNAGFGITLTDSRTADTQTVTLQYPGGIKSCVAYMTGGDSAEPLHNVLYFSAASGDRSAEVALRYHDSGEGMLLSFANDRHTIDGGTHETGFKTALSRAVNRTARQLGYLKAGDENLTYADLQKGLIAVLSVRLKKPQFEGATKWRLGNPVMQTMVDQLLVQGLMDAFAENPAVAQRIIENALRT